MTFSEKKQKPDIGQKNELRSEEQFGPEQAPWDLSNSFMIAMPMVPPPGTPNSVMRQMMDPAEAEADRLSAGVTSGTPNSVRKEMGHRLGSDFSSVNFHTGPESVRRNEAMGARAYTRGNDVYFGRGGFDPSVGAHELVHTVQQGAVFGHTSQTVSFGTVQMWPKWLEGLRDRFRRFRKSMKREAEPVAEVSGDAESETISRPASAAPDLGSAHSVMIGDEAAAAKSPSDSPSPAPGEEPVVDKPIPAKLDDSEEEMGPPPPPSGSPSPALGEEPAEVKPVETQTRKAEESSPPPTSAAPSSDLEDDEDDEEDDEFETDLPDNLEVRDRNGEWVDLMPRSTISSGPAPVHPDGKRGILSNKYLLYFIINDRGQIEVCANGVWTQVRQKVKVKRAPGEKPEGKGTASEGDDLKKTMRKMDAEESVLREEDDESGSKAEIPGKKVVPTLEEGIPPWDGTADPDETEITASDTEEELVDLPKRKKGRYHPGFSAMGTAKEVNSYVGLLNSFTGAVNGIDQLGAAGLDALQDFKPGTGPNTYDYNTNEGPVFTGATQLMGAGTSLVSTVTGVHDTIRQAANVEVGGSKLDAVQSGLDTVSSAGRVLSSGAGFLDTVGAMTPVADFIPGMNIATGSLTAISGSVQAIRGRVAMHKINNEIRALKKRVNARRRLEKEEAGGTSSRTESADIDEVDEPVAPIVGEDDVSDEDEAVRDEVDAEAPKKKAESPEEIKQNKLWQIFHHGKWISEYNRTAGGMKAGSGLLSIGSGVATLTGAGVAVGAALGAANGALGIGRFAYDKVKKRHIRHRVIAQELGIQESELDKDKILRKYGVSSTKEAFSIIRQERARYLIETAGRDQLNDEDDDAIAADRVINALGVHRKNGRYVEGAEQLLAEKLG